MTDAESRPHAVPRRVAVLGLSLFAIVDVLGTIGASRHQNASRHLDRLAILLVLVGPLALAWFRRHPIVVTWVVMAATLGYLARGYAYGPVIFPAAFVLFATLLTGHRLVAWSGFTVLYVGHLTAQHWILDQRVTWGQALGVAAWGLVILISSEMARVRRERVVASHAARREAGRRQANEERLRIARELHDVVAHHMSLINVQAGVALHLVDRRPDQVQTALAVIKDASKEALVELRSLVGVLRDESDVAPRAPAAMLGSLDELVERSSLAGLALSKRVSGEVAALPAAVELAAFRIVQEAVTNIIRHAGAHHAEILLDYRGEDLLVQVDDDGHGGGLGAVPEARWAEGGGSGLRGMQERASALGGVLSIGRAPSGGVRIRAVLPLRQSS